MPYSYILTYILCAFLVLRGEIDKALATESLCACALAACDVAALGFAETARRYSDSRRRLERRSDTRRRRGGTLIRGDGHSGARIRGAAGHEARWRRCAARVRTSAGCHGDQLCGDQLSLTITRARMIAAVSVSPQYGVPEDGVGTVAHFADRGG